MLPIFRDRGSKFPEPNGIPMPTMRAHRHRSHCLKFAASQFAGRELPVNSYPPVEGATKGPCTIFDIWLKVASITRKMAAKTRPPIGSRIGINQPCRPPGVSGRTDKRWTQFSTVFAPFFWLVVNPDVLNCSRTASALCQTYPAARSLLRSVARHIIAL